MRPVQRGDVHEMDGSGHAVILSMDMFNERSGGLVLAPILSPDGLIVPPPDVPWMVQLEDADPVKGWVRVHRLRALKADSPAFGEHVGRVCGPTMRSIERGLRDLLDLH